ncbi:MAG: hypothetical protein RL266_1167 [Bacteroidota bacterium]|jgi:uncharacterized SAM-binding protein YcdF (DUF218 family)
MKRSTLILLTALLTVCSLETMAKKEQKIYDAVIIPGFPFDPDGKMNAIYRMRLAWAYELYETGRTQHIILSGGAVHSPYYEAEIFALYLIEKGVPAEALILERNAEHSLENVFYSMEIAEKYGFEEVAVATDMWQSGMIQFIAKLEGHDMSKVDFVPAKFSVVNRYWKSFEFEIDHELAFSEDFVPLFDRKDKKVRRQGTHGLLWKPSDEVVLSYATELK